MDLGAERGASRWDKTAIATQRDIMDTEGSSLKLTSNPYTPQRTWLHFNALGEPQFREVGLSPEPPRLSSLVVSSSRRGRLREALPFPPPLPLPDAASAAVDSSARGHRPPAGGQACPHPTAQHPLSGPNSSGPSAAHPLTGGHPNPRKGADCQPATRRACRPPAPATAASWGARQPGLSPTLPMHCHVQTPDCALASHCAPYCALALPDLPSRRLS